MLQKIHEVVFFGDSGFIFSGKKIPGEKIKMATPPIFNQKILKNIELERESRKNKLRDS